MIDIKEIKSIRIVPYTLMNSSIAALMGLIYAIILIIVLSIVGLPIAGISSGTMATLAIALIFILPAGTFLLSIVRSFLTAFLYNALVPKLGGIKLGLEDLKEVKSVPVVPFALMISSFSAIIVFIAMLVIGPIIVFLLQGVALTGRIPGLSSIGAWGILGLLVLVIGVPIMMFVASFIMTALAAIFYNLLAPKIGGIEFEFEALKEKVYAINAISPIKLALITSIVMTIVLFISEFLSVIGNILRGYSITTEIIGLLIRVVFDLVVLFIVYAIMAVLYNFLAPKIGTVKIEME